MKAAYDHRLKELIHTSENPNALLRSLDVPSTTASSWRNRKPKKVISIEYLDWERDKLAEKVSSLELELKGLEVLLNLVETVNETFGLSVEWTRLPDVKDKKSVIDAIKSATETIPLKRCLGALKLSSSRYYSWKKKEKTCDLEDRKSCPRTNPTALTSVELNRMETFVKSKDFAHYPLTALVKKKKKTGELVCSASTWSRMIKKHKWVRPRKRVYPAKAKVGIRASAPGGISGHSVVSSTNFRNPARRSSFTF